MATGATATRGRAFDVGGGAILAASVGWTCWTARTPGSDGGPVAALQLACGASYVGARLLTRWQRPVVPVAIVAGAASALVLGSVVPNLAPLSPPLGYANANAALYVLVAVAAVMAAAAFPPGSATAVAVPVAGAFALAAVVSGSVTGMIVLGLAVVAVAARALGSTRSFIVLCVIAVQVVVAVTAVVGVDRAPKQTTNSVEDRIDTRRVALWRDAAVIARAHPLAGAGPGQFQDVSPSARRDADARWAHSGFLQQGAEQGAVGLGLLLAAFGWGFARLWWIGSGDAFTTLGAMALAALGLHASVDYVLHFATVPLVAAALVGAATARPASPLRAPRAGSVAAGSRC